MIWKPWDGTVTKYIYEQTAWTNEQLWINKWKYSYTFLALTLDAGEQLDSHSTHFNPQGNGLQYQLDRKLNGPQSQPGCLN